MSTLSPADRRLLESLFDMSSGYVLNFSDRTFGDFVDEVVGLNIHAEQYSPDGTSKAKKLRTFWRLESDYTVGKLLAALIDHSGSYGDEDDLEKGKLRDRCREIATRLLARSPSLRPLKEHAEVRSANHLAEQIKRIEASVEADPSLAIGTAKELIETCCKTILAERGQAVEGSLDTPALTKRTLKELRLVPEGVPGTARGRDIIKRILSNLGSISQGLAELRGLYGTGHGRHGTSAGLLSRHAKLAIGSAATLAVFLFETHEATTALTEGDGGEAP